VPFDLLLIGGDVVDPGGGHTGRLDVGVRGGRIAAVAAGLPRDGTVDVVDVSGRLVTPGLVDLHTHTAGGYWGIEPDPIAWHTGVTTWVDAGSTGAYTFQGPLRHGVRTPMLLNISGTGLAGHTGESRDLAACDIDAAIATVLANRETVVGVKVRMDRGATGDNGLEPLRRALAVGWACDVPVMAHIAVAPPSAGDVLALLRPGDIVTHCASGNAAGLLRDGVPSPAVRDAYERGVLFDIGHGAGGFSFPVLEAFLAAGIVPHTVSTDLHARCVHGPVFDLPTTMAKMLALGLPLPGVIAAATVRPAQALGLPSGTLAAGAPADIAVFSVEHQPFEVVDAHLKPRTAPLRLTNEATYLAGRLLPAQVPPPPPPWIAVTPAQRAALNARTRAVRDLLARPLVDRAGLIEQFPPVEGEAR
jgi:dihydroorotase